MLLSEFAAMRRLIWVFPVLLAALAAWLGLVWGRAATPGESEVILRYAALYARDRPGAEPTDCAALPGTTPGVWLVIRCRPAGEPGVTYRVDTRGRLLGPAAADPARPGT